MDADTTGMRFRGEEYPQTMWGHCVKVCVHTILTCPYLNVAWLLVAAVQTVIHNARMRLFYRV